jgi:glycosyltransferase involved in cell wall biosynthesis
VPEPFERIEPAGLIGWGLGPPAPGEAVPAIYHVPSPFENVGIEAIWPDWVHDGAEEVRTVVTVHDLVPLVMEELYFGDRPGFKPVYEARLGLIRQAHQVLAISDSTAADAVELLGIDPARITLISSGVSETFSSLVSTAEAAKPVLVESFPGVRDGFLLYVGGGDPRKNMRGTIEAYAKLPEAMRHEHQLVIVCRLGPQETAELRVFAHRLGIAAADVFFAGFAGDRELAALYRGCELFVFPSLYEGFGLPVLEAMSCGAPVAAAANSSIPEVLGDLDATFDAGDPEDIARVLAEVLERPERLEALRERSRRRVAEFTWEKTAAKIAGGYERALSVPAGRGRRGQRRKRVALVTPWPPRDTPAAAAAKDLVAELARLADVDVIVAGGDPAIEPMPGEGNGVRFFSIAELDWLLELRDRDALLYSLDDSPQSQPIAAALERHPGKVIRHGDGHEPGPESFTSYAELLEL